ncbi:hypothetical protein AGMMS49942_26740 [Spirochaetia bacterium]|nr:hypothetical protein AGMMS49942_26740 [Spirochaetia bacterium]
MSKVMVKNASSDLYDGVAVSNFLEYWEQRRYSDKKTAAWCRHCGEKKKHDELVGSHVIKTAGRDYNVYLVPCCDACNNYNNTDAFEVSEDDLIAAPLQH